MEKPQTPKYRKQKRPNGRHSAFVQIDGKRYRLGVYNSEESWIKYHRLIAEWAEAGFKTPLKVEDDVTVSELVARFWEHAKKHYRRQDGAFTSEISNYRICIRDLRNLYDDILVKDFRPTFLKIVRTQMVDRNLCRRSINSMIGRIKRMFKWGVENELVPVEIYEGLRAVRNLQLNRSEAKESEPREPVALPHIKAVKPFVTDVVWSMIQFQLATAARPGEILKIRECDIDMTKDVWIYCPKEHKTTYKGFKRTIHINAVAQTIIKPLMAKKVKNEYIFSPSDSELEMRDKRRKNRKTPLSYGNRQGTNIKENPQRRPNESYSTDSYRKAISRACENAKIPLWSPHRLRHNAATLIREVCGIEPAQLLLGHRTLSVTQVYAKPNEQKAIDAIKKLGETYRNSPIFQ